MRWFFYEGVVESYSTDGIGAKEVPELLASAREAMKSLEIEEPAAAEVMPHWNGEKIHPGLIFTNGTGTGKIVLATLKPLEKESAHGLVLIGST